LSVEDSAVMASYEFTGDSV